MPDQKAQKITYFVKEATTCPICETKFYREELYSGGGRLVAGELTDELRRLYEPTQKYGELFPLVYVISVCPECYYAAQPQDFVSVTPDIIEKINLDREKRRSTISLIFPQLNFNEPRGLAEGIASYYLAVMSYEYFPPSLNPTFKRGLYSLRAAWLLQDMHSRFPGEHYDYVSRLFYRKAQFFYDRAYELDISGDESLGEVRNFGPDTDKNYGYDGFLYLLCLLRYKYGQRRNRENRIKSLEDSKRILSKVFGIGKASKAKPSVILEKAKVLFEKIGNELKELGQEK